MVPQIDKQHAAMIAYAMAPARKTDVFVNESFGRLSTIMRSVAMHGSLSVRITGKSRRAGDAREKKRNAVAPVKPSANSTPDQAARNVAAAPCRPNKGRIAAATLS